MFSVGIKCNYIIWKFQKNLSPPTFLHFKYNNFPITCDRDGNRNKVIKRFSYNHTSQLASKNPDQCQSQPGFQTKSFKHHWFTIQSLGPSEVTHHEFQPQPAGMCQREEERQYVALAKPVNRDSQFIFHSCFLWKQQKKILNYKGGVCLFSFIVCSYDAREKGAAANTEQGGRSTSPASLLSSSWVTYSKTFNFLSRCFLFGKKKKRNTETIIPTLPSSQSCCKDR